ncbi:site-specific DNA-methyltransferase [Sphingopyxis sp. PET50]|uniref:site-specific DNA-methyltransferase n=1 Tax=Sphingopyxis sp. PET50 TaxID=2976533 RepID=UPI0021AFD42C|nr:site-specific DNA-methyltransferase [Sphingopyxis sp. PET50]
MPSLTWLTRDEDLKRAAAVPYRLLEADPALSHGDPATGNMLIQGDNLDALKALLPYYKGRVKCIYIDPPYNTRSAFEHYDDNLEHSQWLAMIYPRLELLRDLLAEDGSIWVSIDDNEGHYLKVVMDEVFGRKNFVATNLWQKRYSRENREAIGDSHEFLLVYSLAPDRFKNGRNLLPLGQKQRAVYRNPDDDERGPWQSVSLLAQGFRPNQMYEITAPNGRVHVPPAGNCWKVIQSEYDKLIADNRVYFGRDGNGVPRRKEFLSKAKGLVPWTWWPHEEVGHTGEAKNEVNALFGAETSFGTPKPERLIERVLHIATNPGELVLDSFLGSGTTAAVAHKMGRQWIGVEMGDHAVTHCAPRLTKVIDGEQGGISQAVNWQGGGGFNFYRLGEPVFDEDGRIRPGIKFAALAAHIWFSETGFPYQGTADRPFLGSHGTRGFALLYNGILGDKRMSGGNVLTNALLASIRAAAGHDGPLTIYGEASRIGDARLKAEGVTFKQTPYDVKAR